MDQKEIQKITSYIFLESKPQKVDMALVFGTRHPEAINSVYELYRDKFVLYILVSGGENRVTGENKAQEMSKKLIKLGVKKEDIILENQSTNTLENEIGKEKVMGELNKIAEYLSRKDIKEL